MATGRTSKTRRSSRALDFEPEAPLWNKVLESAREFAERAVKDPGLGNFMHVLEVEIFEEWRAVVNEPEAAARAIRLLDGSRAVLSKLHELAQKKG